MQELDDFTKSYLICALFASTDDDGTPLDHKYSIHDFDEKAVAQAIHECRRFQHVAFEYGLIDSELLEDAGHDFWLTRNGHGAGFWDRPELYGDNESRDLTLISHCFGECSIYKTNENKLSLE